MLPFELFSRFILPLAASVLCLCGSQVFAEDKPSAEWVAELRASAEKGDAASQTELAGLYHFGKGVTLDHTEEVKWFRKAADQGYAKAQHNLGICYSEGIGVAKNPVEAFKWYLKAAEQKYLDAQYRVGVCYLEGHGIPRSNQEGSKWLEKAANRGDADSQFALGAYFDKQSVIDKKDFDGSLDRQIAADQSVASRYGKWPQPYEEYQRDAYMWYNLATSSGHAGAKRNLEILSTRMSPTLVEEAQEKSTNWRQQE